MFISTALAQAAPAPTSAAGGPDIMTSFLPLILMVVVMYFLLIRPQQKRQKETRAMLDALAKGDEVVTIGGILGRITKIDESFVSLEIAGGVEVQVERSAVAKPLPKGTFKKELAKG